jgi:hypothetical protein
VAAREAADAAAPGVNWLIARKDSEGGYFILGVEHILFGIDHLLFVLALVLIVRGVGLLVKTITAFTIAHSITLALATLGLVNVPSAPVEAVIALSIVFVAAEIIHMQRGVEGIAARAPWIVAIAGHNYFLKVEAANALRAGMKSAVQHAASSSRAAALIPSLYYNELENEHLPACASRPGYMVATKPWDIFARYHQMLGNTGSSQEARPVERDEVLLLQLKSDYGVNFMFCDVGEAEFWIKKSDLAVRQFDKVFATTCGG